MSYRPYRRAARWTGPTFDPSTVKVGDTIEEYDCEGTIRFVVARIVVKREFDTYGSRRYYTAYYFHDDTNKAIRTTEGVVPVHFPGAGIRKVG